MREVSDHLYLMTDDGSNGHKGFVTAALEENIKNGAGYDFVVAIGPLPMMRAVCNLTKEARHRDHDHHEPHHDRRHRHVRRLPLDRGRRDQVRLCGRAGLRRPPEVDFDEAMNAAMYRPFDSEQEEECNTRIQLPFDGGCRAWPNMDAKKDADAAHRTGMFATKTLKRLRWATPMRWPWKKRSAASTANTNPAQNGCPVGRRRSRNLSRMWPEGTWRTPTRLIKPLTSLPAVCGRVCPQENAVRAQLRARHQGRAGGHRPAGALCRRLAYEARRGESPKRSLVKRAQGGRHRRWPGWSDLCGRLEREWAIKVTVYEALHTAGGVLMYGIPAVPSAQGHRAAGDRRPEEAGR